MGGTHSALLLPMHASEGEAICEAVVLLGRGHNVACNAEPEAITLLDDTGEVGDSGEGFTVVCAPACGMLDEGIGNRDTDPKGDADAETDVDGLPDSESNEGWLGVLTSDDELVELRNIAKDALPAWELDGNPDCVVVKLQVGDGGPFSMADELGELVSLPVTSCELVDLAEPETVCESWPLTVLVINVVAVCI